MTTLLNLKQKKKFGMSNNVNAHIFHTTKSTGDLVPQLKENQMKSKIIQTLVECVLAIVIFGGIGVLLAWRG
jgi:hypothetical protein